MRVEPGDAAFAKCMSQRRGEGPRRVGIPPRSRRETLLVHNLVAVAGIAAEFLEDGGEVHVVLFGTERLDASRTLPPDRRRQAKRVTSMAGEPEPHREQDGNDEQTEDPKELPVHPRKELASEANLDPVHLALQAALDAVYRPSEPCDLRANLCESSPPSITSAILERDHGMSVDKGALTIASSRR